MLGPHLVRVGPSLVDPSEIWPNLAQHGSKTAQVWPRSTRLRSIRAKLGRSRTRPSLAELGHMLPNSSHMLPSLGDFGPNSGRAGPLPGEVWPGVRPDFGDFDSFWLGPNSGKCEPPFRAPPLLRPWVLIFRPLRRLHARCVFGGHGPEQESKTTLPFLFKLGRIMCARVARGPCRSSNTKSVRLTEDMSTPCLSLFVWRANSSSSGGSAPLAVLPPVTPLLLLLDVVCALLLLRPPPRSATDTCVATCRLRRPAWGSPSIASSWPTSGWAPPL